MSSPPSCSWPTARALQPCCRRRTSTRWRRRSPTPRRHSRQAPQRQAAPLITPGDDSRRCRASLLACCTSSRRSRRQSRRCSSGHPACQEEWLTMIEAATCSTRRPGRSRRLHLPPSKQRRRSTRRSSPIAGGRYYHRVQGKFVDSPYLDASPAPAVAHCRPAQRAPRTRAKGKAHQKAPAAIEAASPAQAGGPAGAQRQRPATATHRGGCIAQAGGAAGAMVPRERLIEVTHNSTFPGGAGRVYPAPLLSRFPNLSAERQDARPIARTILHLNLRMGRRRTKSYSKV